MNKVVHIMLFVTLMCIQMKPSVQCVLLEQNFDVRIFLDTV